MSSALGRRHAVKVAKHIDVGQVLSPVEKFVEAL
jgi:hypothetical protein